MAQCAIFGHDTRHTFCSITFATGIPSFHKGCIFQGAVLPVRVGTKAKAAPKRDRDQNLQKAGVGAAIRSCQQLSAFEKNDSRRLPSHLKSEYLTPTYRAILSICMHMSCHFPCIHLSVSLFIHAYSAIAPEGVADDAEERRFLRVTQCMYWLNAVE